MGRELKRVALDFDWPLNERWKGYLNPHYKQCKECPFCEGGGLNPESKQISDDWYDFAETGRRWCSQITQDEVDALLDAGRLMGFTHRFVKGEGNVRIEPQPIITAGMVNAWNGGQGLGHDAINRWVCVETRCKRLGVWGYCEHCDGDGEVWLTAQAKAGSEAWEETEPPEGKGWQIWETVSEGSPVSPVFASSRDMESWLIKQGYSEGAAEEFTRVGHAFSMAVRQDSGRITDIKTDIESLNMLND